MRVLLMVIVALLCSCAQKEESTERKAERGRVRLEIFYKCLDASKVNQSVTHYADNAEVVDECSSAAYHTAYSIVPYKSQP